MVQKMKVEVWEFFLAMLAMLGIGGAFFLLAWALGQDAWRESGYQNCLVTQIEKSVCDQYK